MLGKIFEHKEEEATGSWRKLLFEYVETHNLYS